MHAFFRSITVALVVATAPALAQTPAQSVSLTLGIVPQQSASRTAELWTPVCEYLSAKTGYRVTFETAKDIPTFEQRLLAGAYDVAYMNPYHYTVFHAKPGYRAIAREANRKIQGIVVVRKDSPIQDIKELAGKTVAFPAPAAFAATVLPLASFQAQGIKVTPRYVASHDSVYMTVMQGLYPAGGGITRTLSSIPQDTQDQLRVLWKTKEFTPHAIAVHPRLKNRVVDRLTQAMVKMADDPDGKTRLDALGFSGLSPARDSDWNDIRALKLTNLNDLLASPTP